MFKSNLPVLAALLLLVSLAACGRKGALYIEAPRPAAAQPAQPAPVSQPSTQQPAQ